MQPYYQPVPAAPTPFTINSTFHDPAFSASQTSAWAVNVQNSSNLIMFGASLCSLCEVYSSCPLRPIYVGMGLYSFFQNYGQDCLSSASCQNEIFNIDDTSTISVYSLSTVGVTYQLSVSSQPVIPQIVNVNGFASTATLWTG